MGIATSNKGIRKIKIKIMLDEGTTKVIIEESYKIGFKDAVKLIKMHGLQLTENKFEEIFEEAIKISRKK